MRIFNCFKHIAALAVLGLAVVACEPEAPNTPNTPENPENNEQAEAKFDIVVEEVHAAKAITQVTPKDADMYYVMFLDEVSYLQFNNIVTAEQLWEDDYEAFERGALANNMNLKEYMVASNIVFKGAQRVLSACSGTACAQV